MSKGVPRLWTKRKVARLLEDLDSPVEYKDKRLSYKDKIIWKNYIQLQKKLFECGACGKKQFIKEACQNCGGGVFIKSY